MPGYAHENVGIPPSGTAGRRAESTITVAGVGRTWVTLNREISRGDQLCATGRLVAVHVGQGGRTEPWPGEQRNLLEGHKPKGPK